MTATRITSTFTFVVLLMQTTAFAVTLQDYRERLERASAYALELDAGLQEEDVDLARETVAEIRILVPASEKIGLSGGDLEIDNQWLHTLLDEFERQEDDPKRHLIIVDIGERLAALADSVREQEAAVAAARTKDEDKQKLDEILRRAEYQKPDPKEESVFEKWWREFREWLASIWPRPDPSTAPGWNLAHLGFIVQMVIFALVLALIGFVIWRLAMFISARAGPRTKKKREDRIILGERVGADESASDIFGEAEALAREGNLRGAIRRAYIAALCELGDRKVVRLARHKTNRDYLRDVRKVDVLFQNMTGLTNGFERTWYGLRTPEPADWDEFRTTYRETVSNAARMTR